MIGFLFQYEGRSLIVGALSGVAKSKKHEAAAAC